MIELLHFPIHRLGAWGCLTLLTSMTACASMHQYHFGDIDSSRGTLEPFEIQVDELGVSVRDGAAVAKAAAPKAKKKVGTAESVISLFQTGHATGNPTFNDDFADELTAQILERCPSGQVTGLVAIRETMKYPVVSGEIVTLRGYCIRSTNELRSQ